MEDPAKFSERRARLRPLTLAAILLFHCVLFYGLVRAFAPDLAQAISDDALAAVTFTPPPPPPQNPEEAHPAQDEGAAGLEGKRAKPKPKPVTAPSPKIPRSPIRPAPRASSTGRDNQSGARETGAGTGAGPDGVGTGSGRGGSGWGGIAVTKPIHISGTINSARDYPAPPGGRAARMGTQVIVRVIVGVDGRARNCRIHQASPHPPSDQITCQLVMQRLRFKPAVNRNGEPVAAAFHWRQRWF